jgi:hypothetical protein
MIPLPDLIPKRKRSMGSPEFRLHSVSPLFKILSMPRPHVILGIVLMGWLSWLFGCGSSSNKPTQKPADAPYEQAEVYRGLRQQILEMQPEAIGVSADVDRPLAMLMEMGRPGAAVTLVAVADGTASLYFSNGGGMIGAGAYEPVQRAGANLLAEADKHREHLATTQEYPLPDQDQVRFYVIYPDCIRTAAAPLNERDTYQHSLSPLFYSANDLLTAIRENSPPQ